MCLPTHPDVGWSNAQIAYMYMRTFDERMLNMYICTFGELMSECSICIPAQSDS